MTTLRTRPARGLLPVLLAAPFLAQADATIANVATPAIRTDLHASPAAVELVIGGYLVTYAALLITGARLGQTHGYKRLFLLGVTLFGISSLVGGLAPNPAVLIAMRVLQGAAAALMYPQTLTGIQLAFTGRERARAIGLFAIALSTGAVVGQILGGVLVSADLAGTGWRPIFLVNVPICLGVALAALRVLPTDAPPGGARLDIPGVLALTATVLLVVVPLTLGHAEGWPVWTWLCLTAAAPTFWLFLTGQRRRQARGAAPLIDIHVVRRPPVLLGLLALLTTTGTYYALLFTLAQYIQQGLGRGALASGLLLVPWVAAFGIAGQITRRLPPRATPLLPAIGYALLTIAYLTIGVLLYTGRPGDGWLIPLLGLGGLGLGTGFATLLTHLTNAVPASNAPDISGVSTTTTQIGGAIGVAAFGGLYFALAHQPGDETQARHAFAITCIALAAATLTAILTAHLATHRRPADSATTEAYCG